ncbi:MAG: tetratricopeptide repeat protein [Nostochopsis sp.]
MTFKPCRDAPWRVSTDQNYDEKFLTEPYWDAKEEEGEGETTSELDKLLTMLQQDNAIQSFFQNLEIETNKPKTIIPELITQISTVSQRTIDAAEVWIEKANQLYNLGHYEDAIASYDKAVEIKPDKDQAWYNRGNALGYLGRNQEAIASYDKALEIKPDKDEAWNNRGVALVNLGRNQEAIAS